MTNTLVEYFIFPFDASSKNIEVADVRPIAVVRQAKPTIIPSISPQYPPSKTLAILVTITSVGTLYCNGLSIEAYIPHK